MNAVLVNFEAEKLKRLEQSAHAQHEGAKKLWRLCLETCLEIQASELWQKEHPKLNWAQYCHEYLPLEASSIRAYRMGVPIAILAETLLGVALSKNQALKLAKRLSDIVQDETLLGETYEKAWQNTGHIVPSEGELRAVYDVLERKKREGVVTVNGLDFHVDSDAEKQAILEELYELKQRQLLHIENSQKIAQRRVEIASKAAIETFFDYSSAKTSDTLFDFIFGYKERKQGSEADS